MAKNNECQETVAVVGLGYVGLPLAVAFGRQRPTLGYDTDSSLIPSLRAGRDPGAELSAEQIQSASHLDFTSDSKELARASILIIAVPTPIDEAQRPDLAAMAAACQAVGEQLRPGAIVVFESTVYPGCTEEFCIPLLEKHSGLSWGHEQGFFVGYSPERINPGDREHTLANVVKVVAGDCPQTLETLCELYESVVEAGLHRASSIKVAEAAKVIENTQRDLNIALMNELAMIFNRLDIDTSEVLEAAGSKWNFLPFRPGLVGGHCIGVDPYYLTYKAQAAGFHPEVVLGGRRTNDGMGQYIAGQTVKELARQGLPVSGARIAVLGLTFKENCADVRNSRVVDVVRELESYCCEVRVHDPRANAANAMAEHDIELLPWEALAPADALILAVPHGEFLTLGLEGLATLLRPAGVLIDVKSVLDREEAAARQINLWRL